MDPNKPVSDIGSFSSHKKGKHRGFSTRAPWAPFSVRKRHFQVAVESMRNVNPCEPGSSISKIQCGNFFAEFFGFRQIPRKFW